MPAEPEHDDLAQAKPHKIAPQSPEHDPLSPATLHGLLFDAAVFAGLALFYLGLVPIPNPSLDPTWGDDDVSDWVVGLWLAGAILAQILGALLKAPALRHRLARRRTMPGKALKRTIALLWWVHFLFFTFLVAFSLALLGWALPATDKITGAYMLWGTTVFAIGGLTTLATRWAAKPGSESAPSPPTRPGLEYLGDFLLLVSVLILTRVFWNPMAALFTTGEIGFGPGLVQVIMRVVLFLCMLYLFVVFYLPPRLLFLVEDGHRRRTWIQMGIVLAPLTWHVFFG